MPRKVTRIALQQIRFGTGEKQSFVERGESLEIPPDLAARWDAAGVTAEPGLGAPVPQRAAKPTATGEIAAAILAAAEMLDPVEGFNADGKPGVYALEKVLGYDITEAERDAAWAEHSAAKKTAGKASGKDPDDPPQT